METIRRALALLLAACTGGCGLPNSVTRRACEQQCNTTTESGVCVSLCGRCLGDCLPLPPEGFDRHALLWVGEAREEPDCPPEAPVTVFLGYLDPDVPFDCLPCSCTEPTCGPPDELQITSSSTCDGDDLAPYDAPDILSGACAPPGEALSRHRKSLLVSPPKVGACEPFVEPPPVLPITFSPWERAGKGCGGVLREYTCHDPSAACVPGDKTELFSQCMLYLGDGEVTCPQEFPVQQVLYGRMLDERGCTPCTCGPPTGSDCAMELRTYRDDGCNDLLSASRASQDAAACITPAPGPGPQSIRATWHASVPGSCEPGGGEPTGELDVTARSIFCCATAPGAPEE
ncbi:hypothetical protein [Sorangium sp. So ce131]|uniref:hypothetical protein n=1 Tax=Sorangium sp. So ce131 TaxID=3133282 RepID=UPI003F60E8D0